MTPSGTGHPERLTRKLLAWYAASQRDLPWRHTRDPYRIWLSEVMLQQTQVATVIPYYNEFLSRYPDARALAAAPLDDVLKRWEGLGYYARARNFHRAVRAVVASHGASVPDDPALFGELPGVGEYTVAAVQSIAFGHPLAVVDGNVKRVIARVLALEASVDSPAGKRRVQTEASRLLGSAPPGDFNQALMELGALVCRPLSPACDECPWQNDCAAYSQGEPERFPVRAPKKVVPRAHIAVGVVYRSGRVLITRRAESGMLGGLWEFPGGKVRAGESAEAACVREIREEVSLRVKVEEHIARVRHAYTHLHVEIDVFACRPQPGDVVLDGPVDYRWIRPGETGRFAFPKANHKFIPAVRETLAARHSRRRRP